jgi:hypothetical protein
MRFLREVNSPLLLASEIGDKGSACLSQLRLGVIKLRTKYFITLKYT